MRSELSLAGDLAEDKLLKTMHAEILSRRPLELAKLNLPEVRVDGSCVKQDDDDQEEDCEEEEGARAVEDDEEEEQKVRKEQAQQEQQQREQRGERAKTMPKKDTDSIDENISVARVVPTLRACASCGAPDKADTSGRKNRPCARCKVTFYCSTRCQQRDWRSGGHKKRCTVPPKELQVDRYRDIYPAIEGPFAGVHFSPQPPEVTRIVFMEGQFDVKVHGKKGLGFKKGLQVDDHLVEINSQPVDQTMEDEKFVEQFLSLGRPIVLGFSRNGASFVNNEATEKLPFLQSLSVSLLSSSLSPFESWDDMEQFWEENSFIISSILLKIAGIVCLFWCEEKIAFFSACACLLLFSRVFRFCYRLWDGMR